MRECIHCGGTGFIHITATREDVPWRVEWRDASYHTPCHECPAGQALLALDAQLETL